MKKPKVVQIRKKSGLEKIKTQTGASINPKVYHQDIKDPNVDGVMLGDYRGKSILDTRYGISPVWNEMKNQWSWGGSEEDLVRLVRDMKLRYPSNHEKAGQIIKPFKEGHEASRLTYRFDEIFQHADLYGHYYMEDGRISLNLADPKQEFLYLCYKGDHLTDDKSGDGPISKFVKAGQKFEIVSPNREIKKQKEDASKEIQAITLLAKMDGDEDRLRAICEIMDLPGYSSVTDINGAFLILKDMAAQNTSVSSKYNGKTYQNRFIELATMPDDDLKINQEVITAKKKGILRARKGYYISYDGSRLEGVGNDSQLIAYFRNPNHQDEYLELIDALSNAN